MYDCDVMGSQAMHISDGLESWPFGLAGWNVYDCGVMGAQATHIFDGLESWPTHLAYVAGGRLQEFAPAATFPELKEGRLLDLVERCETQVSYTHRNTVE